MRDKIIKAFGIGYLLGCLLMGSYCWISIEIVKDKWIKNPPMCKEQK